MLHTANTEACATRNISKDTRGYIFCRSQVSHCWQPKGARLWEPGFISVLYNVAKMLRIGLLYKAILTLHPCGELELLNIGHIKKLQKSQSISDSRVPTDKRMRREQKSAICLLQYYRHLSWLSVNREVFWNLHKEKLQCLSHKNKAEYMPVGITHIADKLLYCGCTLSFCAYMCVCLCLCGIYNIRISWWKQIIREGTRGLPFVRTGYTPPYQHRMPFRGFWF